MSAARRSPGARSPLLRPFHVGMVLVACALLALVSACGGGGGGGGGPTTPGPSVTFSPSGVSGPNALVLREGPGSNANRLVLELVAEEVNPLYGISFDLQYPSSVLSFDAATEEGFLGSDGETPTLQVAEGPVGNLVIGLSRLGPVPGIAGSGVLLTLQFRTVGGGSGSFRFDANQGFDANGDPLPAIAWGAGSVRVVQ